MVSDKLFLVLCMILIFINTIKAEDKKCSCGMTNPSRIVGGKETGVNEFPMMAVIWYIPKKKPFCGATIISEMYVITAAYCVVGLEDQLKDLLVKVGVHNIGGENDDSKDYKIAHLIPHKDYDSEKSLNDVAIVTLEEKIEFSMKVGPACLPFNYVRKHFVEQKVTAVGYKREKNAMHKIELDVVPPRNCKKRNSNMICTWGESEGKGTCPDDVGGPLLWRNSSSEHTMLVGVLGSRDDCKGKSAEHNLLVGHYLDFIVDNTQGARYCRTY